jgi:MFS family permease
MRVIKERPAFAMMAVGCLFYLVGFAMFAVFSAYTMFVVAIVVITGGEMITMPTAQALATGFARVDMRGRYMALFDLNQKIPAMIGPAAAGIVLDGYNPDLLWYAGAALCAVAACWFQALHTKLGGQPRFATVESGVERTEPAIL